MVENSWSREVIDIDKLEEELKKNKINIRDIFNKVLKEDTRFAKNNKKRFQQQRFLTILGAVYADNTVYSDKERKKHIAKLKKYYNQENKKTKNGEYQYLNHNTANFYCDLLNIIEEQIKREYPNFNAPKETIEKPKSKNEITRKTTRRSTTNHSNRSTPNTYVYPIMDIAKLDFVSPENLHEYCKTILNQTINDENLTSAQKDQLVKMIADIEYGYSNFGNGNSENKTLTDLLKNRISYKNGSRLSKNTQKLYVDFINKLEEKIKQDYPNNEIEKENINILWMTKKDDNIFINDVSPNGTKDKVVDEYPKNENISEVINQNTRDFSSDEWNQALTIAAETAANTSAQLKEGIAVSALKDILGNKFPKNWGNMTLDEQENVIKSLTPVQVSKFNIKIAELEYSLAETLPPNFLELMARNTDRALEDNKLSEDERGALKKQRNCIVDVMSKQIQGVGYEQIIDAQNAAGVYDGFSAMLDYLEEKNVVEQNEANHIRSILNKAIEEYDEQNGLSDIDEKSANAIEKTHHTLLNDVKNSNFEDLLDEETKKTFASLAFPVTVDENGKEIPSEENKKLFIETVVNTAVQKTAVAHKNKKGDELKEAFKEQLTETTIMEITSLIAAQETINATNGEHEQFNSEKDTDTKKQKLKEYLIQKSDKILISQDALAGYFANKINNQSLFVNRLAKKLKNRNAAILSKMWEPFKQVDKTCINRFGKFYSLPKAILKNQAKNLPWTLGMAAARVAAFSVAATPYGWAAVAAYGAASVGVTWYRMRKNYKQQKKQDPNMTAGKFFKKNWSGVLLSAVGTAASVVPGLAASVEGLQGAVDSMKDCGMLVQTNIPAASALGMTNLSVAMAGAGMLDSTIRGAITQRENGESLGKAIMFGALTGVISTSAGIGMGVGASQACNYAFDTGMNLAGDTRTLDSVDGDMSRPVSLDEFNQRIEIDGLKDELEALQSGNLSQAEYNEKLNLITSTLEAKGLVLTATDNAQGDNITIKWSEATLKATDDAIENSESTVKYWTSSNPEIYDQNIETLKPIIQNYNEQHPDAPLDLHRAYHTMLLMGARAVAADVDTLQNHVNGGGTVACRGLHTVVTDNHVELHSDWGVSVDDAQAVRATTDSSGIMDAQAVENVIDTVAAVEKYISENGEVGQNINTRSGAHTDGYLHRNATIDHQTGEHIRADQNGKIYDTYVNGESAHETIYSEGSQNFVISQKQEQIHMPLNAEPLVFSKAQWLAKIMGNNARASKECATTKYALGIETPNNENNSTPNKDSQKKPSLLSRLFRRSNAKK